VDVADAAVAAMSGGTSQPNLNSIVEALRHTPRDTQSISMRSMNAPIIGRRYAPTICLLILRPGQALPASINTKFPAANTPTCANKPPPWPRSTVARSRNMYARVNQLFGDIVKVTPSSKVVGDMALFLMAKEMTPEDC